MTAEQKAEIDNMSQFELCRIWRFSKSGNPLLMDDTGQYFKERLREKGGFTPEISKKLGWGGNRMKEVISWNLKVLRNVLKEHYAEYIYKDGTPNRQKLKEAEKTIPELITAKVTKFID